MGRRKQDGGNGDQRRFQHVCFQFRDCEQIRLSGLDLLIPVLTNSLSSAGKQLPISGVTKVRFGDPQGSLRVFWGVLSKMRKILISLIFNRIVKHELLIHSQPQSKISLDRRVLFEQYGGPCLIESLLRGPQHEHV